MLSRCLNSSCGAPYHFLQEGRIFNIERFVAMPGKGEPQRLVEQYWLCGLCSQGLKVVVENGCVMTRPIHLELPAGETTKDTRAPMA